MSEIWSDRTRFEIWLEVEVLALEKMIDLGLAPKGSADEVRAKAKIDPARILEIEDTVKHDVIAFISQVAESVGPAAGYLHRGMTSNDLLDTSFAVQLVRSGKMILAGIDQLRETVKAQALRYKHTACVGRTHGIHAEPVTFGLKLAGWFAELTRARTRIEGAISEVAVGKISGPVGTYSGLPPTVEQYVLSKLGLAPETVATQVVQRDRHAAFFNALALLGSSIERFAVEIRHLQRTEVREVEEPFGKGQKGSSAMPHKRNPILSENVCGLARLLRGYAMSALENVPLWHERDISHSSVERVIAPDACIVADFILHRFNSLVAGMVVHEQRMIDNLNGTRGLVFSAALLTALVDAGVARDEAYPLVQRHALAAWEGGPSLEERVSSDAAIVGKLGAEGVHAIFDLKKQLRHVDTIFDRAFLER